METASRGHHEEVKYLDTEDVRSGIRGKKIFPEVTTRGCHIAMMNCNIGAGRR